MADKVALITPEIVLSYPNLFAAKLGVNAKPSDKPKFSTAVLFTHEAVRTPEYAAIVSAVEAAAIAAFTRDGLREMMEEGTFQSPFKKDIRSKGYDAAVFAVRINVSSGQDYPPAIVNRSGLLITDKREIYPGVRARVSLVPRAYGGPGTPYKPGVQLDLRNVQKLGDGPRLAGGAGDGSEFGKLPELPPADMADEMRSMLG